MMMIMSSLTMILLPVFLLSSVLVVQSFTMPPRNDAGSQVQHEPSPIRIRQLQQLRRQQQQQQHHHHNHRAQYHEAGGKRQQSVAAAALNHPEQRPYSVTGARKTTRPPPYTRNPTVAAANSLTHDHLYAPATSDPLPSLMSYEDQELGDMMLQETTRGDDGDDHHHHNPELRSYASRQRLQQQNERREEPEEHDTVTPDFYSLTPSSSLLSPAASTAKDMVAESTHHHDQHEWLDMGAYSGKQGSFGWYADFPVGGIDAKGHGRRKR